MASKVFMTGFPGFIAQRLVDRLLDKDPEARFTFLVQEPMRPVAEASIGRLDGDHPGFAEGSTLVAGDISRPRMGLSREAFARVAAETTHAWHLAAIYDLSVPEAVAYRVNVVGTAEVLDFCERCEGLARLDYVSTCYVAGQRTGLVLERELDEGQAFKNHYESTKCWAELEVRRRGDRVPAVIHRPAIVVGDSQTGETDKYDGPYYIMNLLTKVPSWIPMVHLGAGSAPVNLVPIDFLVDAMAQLWTNEDALGQTLHLADPYPHTAREIVEALLSILGFRKPLASVPPRLVEAALALEPLRNLIKVPREALSYFNHEVQFDTANQQRLLRDTSVTCPDLMDYLPTLVEYVKRNPDKPFLDGRAV